MLRTQHELQPLAPHGAIRWTKPEQLHLTLRFLGNVPFGQIAGLQESLHAACAGLPPLHLRAQGVGFFPNARRPRVVWVGIHDREERLSIFQKTIEMAVQSYTAEQSGERFAGHITLGRFKEHNLFNPKEVAKYSASIKTRLFGEWKAREVEIIRSELLPSGARYTSLAAYELGTMVEPG